MSNEEGEKWIVNLIRDSRMGVDAKIDLASVCPLDPLHDIPDIQNMLHISRPHATPTATLIETTRGLAFRSQAINYAMQNAGGERQEKGERGERGGRGGRGGRGRGGGGGGGGGGREQPNGNIAEAKE